MILGVSSPRIIEHLINRTSQASVLGQVVMQSTTDDLSYYEADGSDWRACGIVAQAGVPVGSAVPIVTSGVTKVLFDATHSPTCGQVVTVSTTVQGRAGYPPVETYAQRIGTVLESGSAPSALVKVNVFFSKTLDIFGGSMDG